MNQVSRARLRIIQGPRNIVIEGSDIRGQKVIDTCHFCEGETQLQLSHVTPRWAGQWMKEEGWPEAEVTRLGVTVCAQDTAKHYLLCPSCEQWLGVAENYLAILCSGDTAQLAARDISVGHGPTLVNVNPKLIRRAVLGILLKAHYATSPPWITLILDVRLVAGIKKRILNDDYNDRSHPLIATKWMSFEVPDANPRAMESFAWRQRPGYTGVSVRSSRRLGCLARGPRVGLGQHEGLVVAIGR